MGGTKVSIEFFPWVLSRHRECETMILGRDVDLSAEVVLDRDIDTAVAEVHLAGFQSQSTAQQLVAEADTNEWNLGCYYVANESYGIISGRCVARTVGDKDTVGIVLLNISEGRV